MNTHTHMHTYIVYFAALLQIDYKSIGNALLFHNKIEYYAAIKMNPLNILTVKVFHDIIYSLILFWLKCK